MPLLSIVIPIYNSEKYLCECLNSILKQNYEDYEVVMVDDGSTDCSYRICRQYQEKDHRFITIHKENGGAISARKVGIKHCTGTYIIAIDSDDYIADGTLAYIAGIIADIAPDILKLNCVRFSETERFEIRNKFQAKLFRQAELNEVYSSLIYDATQPGMNMGGITFSLWSTVTKTAMIRQHQLNVPDEIRLGEDLAVIAPMMFQAESIYFSDRIDYYYRDTPNSMVNSFKKDDLHRLEVLVDYLKQVLPAEIYPSIYVYALIMTWRYTAVAARVMEKNEFMALMKAEVSQNITCDLLKARVNKPTLSERLKMHLLKKQSYKAIWIIEYYYKSLSELRNRVAKKI